MRRTLATLLLLPLFARDGAAQSAQSGEASHPPLELSVALMGETLSHPGIRVGVDWRLAGAGPYGLWLASDLGWYVHPRNHHAFFVAGGLRNRLGGETGLFADLGVRAGLMVAIPAGRVYSRSAGGSIDEISPIAQSRLMLEADLGLGLRFGASRGIRVAPSIHLGAFGEYPFNGYVYLHPFLDAGIGLSFL